MIQAAILRTSLVIENRILAVRSVRQRSKLPNQLHDGRTGGDLGGNTTPQLNGLLMTYASITATRWTKV